MLLVALVIFIIIVALYNVYLALARRKKKKLPPLMINIQVTLNLVLILAGLIYLIFG